MAPVRRGQAGCSPALRFLFVGGAERGLAAAAWRRCVQRQAASRRARWGSHCGSAMQPREIPQSRGRSVADTQVYEVACASMPPDHEVQHGGLVLSPGLRGGERNACSHRRGRIVRESCAEQGVNERSQSARRVVGVLRGGTLPIRTRNGEAPVW